MISPLTLNGENLRLFCLSYYPDSQIELQAELLWQYDRQTVVRLFFALLSGRALPTPAAHQKREQLLAWLPERLKEIDSLAFLPQKVLHDVYMHCSYADLPEKHRIKQQINRLTARALEQTYTDCLPVRAPEAGRHKPVLAVVLEWFTCQHSIYRTHSTSMRALREHFHLLGIAQPGATDEITRTVFDEFYELSAGNAVGDAIHYLSEVRPDVIYYPSVGMFPLTVYLTALRLAPLQLMALGHPATTWSEHIDGVLVEEDYLGDPACFSETICAVPKDAIPYIPPVSTERVLPERTPFRERAKAAWPSALPVRVAVCASVMKINPGFLDTLREISDRSQVPACMAHARRKIHDVHARAPTYITTEALQRIGELYAIEAEVRGCSAEQRLAARKTRAAPLMQSLYDWIQQQMKTLSRHSDTAKAFAYLLKQWYALNVYCSNGWVEIDNNIAENALRGAYFHERRSLNNFHRDRVITFEQIAE
ncbi:hypothetical protein TUM9812_31100 [Escherichia coli]|nr:hypothetical protein TUM9812_31100 [Escherichia coli]